MRGSRRKKRTQKEKLFEKSTRRETDNHPPVWAAEASSNENVVGVQS